MVETFLISFCHANEVAIGTMSSSVTLDLRPKLHSLRIASTLIPQCSSGNIYHEMHAPDSPSLHIGSRKLFNLR